MAEPSLRRAYLARARGSTQNGKDPSISAQADRIE